MIGRFLLRCLLYAVPIAGMLLAYCGWNARFFPAPHVTNNLAVNEKVAAFGRQPEKRPDVLAFGSSMALNNLSSEEVIVHFGAQHYFNLGAWGLDMSQTCELAMSFADTFHPRTVVVVGNLMDFAASLERSELELGPVMRLAENGPSVMPYVLHPDLVYYLRQMESNKLRYTDPGNYECLKMDAHGGVALDVPKDRIIPERWVRPVPEAGDLADAQYTALEHLASGLHDQGIALVYISPPYRDGVRTPQAMVTIANHTARIRELLTAHGQQYCDASDRGWPDELYCDSSHLNGEGARLFTAHVLARIGTAAAH
jgi:hypothetical protein